MFITKTRSSARVPRGSTTNAPAVRSRSVSGAMTPMRTRYRYVPGVPARNVTVRDSPGRIATLSRGEGRDTNPRRITVESANRLVTVATTVVPSGTRSSGPGICAGLPSSARASTCSAGPSAASGRHSARRTSRRTTSVSLRSVPAGTVLSLGTTTSTARAMSAWGAVSSSALSRAAAGARDGIEVWKGDGASK